MLISNAHRALINRLRYKHLHLLALLGETRSLHQTAVKLAVSQPAATRMLREIEETFGFELFERSKRGMHATAVGSELIEFARISIARLDSFSQHLSRFQAGGQGQLLIGTIMGAAPDLVVAAMIDIKARWPLLHISLLGETSDQVIALLEQGRVDVAIARFHPSLHHDRFHFEPLGNERLVALVRPDHALATTTRMPSLARLVREQTWILQPPSSPSRQALERAFEKHGLDSPRHLIECSSIFATLHLAQRSDGIAVLPETVALDYLQHGLLHKLTLSFEEILEPFGIVTRREESGGPRLEEFLELLRVHARNAEAADAAQ